MDPGPVLSERVLSSSRATRGLTLTRWGQQTEQMFSEVKKEKTLTVTSVNLFPQNIGEMSAVREIQGHVSGDALVAVLVN